MGTWDTEDIDFVEEVEKEDETGEKKPKMPEWYRPYMKNRIGWLNGVPQRPATKEDRRRGKWIDVPTT